MDSTLKFFLSLFLKVLFMLLVIQQLKKWVMVNKGNKIEAYNSFSLNYDF